MTLYINSKRGPILDKAFADTKEELKAFRRDLDEFSVSLHVLHGKHNLLGIYAFACAAVHVESAWRLLGYALETLEESA